MKRHLCPIFTIPYESVVESYKDVPKHVHIYKAEASSGVMPLYYLNKILAGHHESEKMAWAVSFTWERFYLFILTSDKTQVLIIATASSSPSAQTQVLGHEPPWRQKMQVGVHSKENIFLQMLASCIYALDTRTSWLYPCTL